MTATKVKRQDVADLCAEHPDWTMKRMGDHLGVTRARMQQIRVILGIPRYNRQTHCSRCNKALEYRRPKYGMCQSCRVEIGKVILNCPTCKKDFVLYRYEYSARKRYNQNFCGRKCRSHYVGITYGFAAHPENAGRRKKVKS